MGKLARVPHFLVPEQAANGVRGVREVTKPNDILYIPNSQPWPISQEAPERNPVAMKLDCHISGDEGGKKLGFVS